MRYINCLGTCSNIVLENDTDMSSFVFQRRKYGIRVFFKFYSAVCSAAVTSKAAFAFRLVPLTVVDFSSYFSYYYGCYDTVVMVVFLLFSGLIQVCILRYANAYLSIYY